MVNTLMDTFENTLNSIRDILRKEGITGMDSIKHCLAFIISRHLTPKICEKLKIEEQYSFNNLIAQKNDEEQFELFYNKKLNCIIGQIHEKMKFTTGFKL